MKKVTKFISGIAMVLLLTTTSCDINLPTGIIDSPTTEETGSGTETTTPTETEKENEKDPETPVQPDDTPKTDETPETEPQPIPEPQPEAKLQADFYSAKMETNNLGSSSNLVYDNENNDIYWTVYQVGTIKNCFIQNIMTPIYNDGNITKLTYTQGTISSQTVSEGVEKVISTTKGTSITTTQATKNSKWNFKVDKATSGSETSNTTTDTNDDDDDPLGILESEGGASKFESTVKLAVGLIDQYFFGGTAEAIGNLLGINGTAKEESSSTSKTTSESTTESINNKYNISTLEQKCKEISIEYDLTKYQEGLYYSLALIGDVNVYQVIAYDKLQDQLYTSYFLSEIDDSKTAIKMVCSEDLNYEIDAEKQIEPIKNWNFNEKWLSAMVLKTILIEFHPPLIF